MALHAAARPRRAGGAGVTAQALHAVSPDCAKDECSRPAASSELCRSHEITRQAAENLYAREVAADASAWAARDHAGDTQVLLGIAKTWADAVAVLVHRGGLTVSRAEQALYDAATPHCHPASRALVALLMPALIEAVDRRADLDCGQVDPHDVVTDRRVWGMQSRFELAAEALDAQIDQSLTPLLHGLPAGAL